MITLFTTVALIVFVTIFVIFSFFVGESIAFLFAKSNRVSPPLSATLGLAAIITTGVVTSSFGIASGSVYFAVLVLSLAYGVITGLLVSKFRLREILPLAAQVAFLVIAALLLHFPYLNPDALNLADDDLAYMPAAMKMFWSGDWSEALSSRRGASFGGQLVLLSIPTAILGSVGYQSVELIFGFMLSIWMILEVLKSPSNRWSSGLIGLVFVLTQAPNVNFSAHISGIPFVLGIWYLLDRKQVNDNYGTLSLALLLAALSSLRATFFLWSLALLVTLALDSIIRRDKALIPLRYLLRVAGLVLLFLAPGIGSMYQAIGTGLFPIFPGNFSQEILPAFPTKPVFDYLYEVLINSGAWTLAPLLVYLLLRGPISGSAHVVLVTFIVTAGITCFGPQHRVIEIYRYLFPFLIVSQLLGIYELLCQISGNAIRYEGAFHTSWLRRPRFFKYSLTVVVAIAITFASIPRLGFPGEISDLGIAQMTQYGITASETQRQVHERSMTAVLQEIPENSILGLMVPLPIYVDQLRFNSVNFDVPGEMASGIADCDLSFKKVVDTLHCIKRMRIQFLVIQDPVHLDAFGLHSKLYWASIDKFGWRKWLPILTPWSERFTRWFLFVEGLKQHGSLVSSDGPLMVFDVNASLAAFSQLPVSGSLEK